MSVIIYIENDQGGVKKGSLDAILFAKKLNKGDLIGVSTSEITDDALNSLGNLGLSKVLKLDNSAITGESTNTLSSAFQEISTANNANFIVMGHSLSSEKVAAKVAVKLNAGVSTNVIDVDTSDGVVVRRGNFTGKAFSNVIINTEKAVLTLKKNSFDIPDLGGSLNIESHSQAIDEKDTKINILETKKIEGDILLPEADLVVSAGRGLKGPENWGMIEELANKLGAATACSKPVSDADWRPHHEHVGQTGLKVSPNLYIAIGISGAIQHLAGVSSSKTIVVINTDADAPFFKAADYGIVGDAFDVVPKLIEALG